MRAHMEEQMREHPHARGAWWAAGRMRGRWRHFIAAHLHRRLFMWFGVSIFVSVAVANVVHGMVGRGRGHWLFAMLAAGMALWLISGKIAYRIARPLHELLRVTEEIGAGRLSARAELHPWRMGEMAYIGQAINDMAARIQKQVGDQREAARGRVARDPHAARAHARPARARALARRRPQDVRRARARGRRRDRHARGPAPRERAPRHFADLTVRTLDAVEVARRALERAGVEEADAARRPARRGHELPGRRHAARARALANLLENARRHGGGVTRLGVLSPRAGAIVFEVEDAGPGFPAAGEVRERQDEARRLARPRPRPRAPHRRRAPRQRHDGQPD